MKLTTTTLIWREGFDKWLPLRDVKELSNLRHNLSECSSALPPPLPVQAEEANRPEHNPRKNIGQQDNGYSSIRLEEINKKHGVPAIISFFLPGVGQLIKGHIGKAFLIWILGVSLFVGIIYGTAEAKSPFTPDMSLLILGLLSGLGLFILCIWNVYDAYNSN